MLIYDFVRCAIIANKLVDQFCHGSTFLAGFAGFSFLRYLG